MADVCLSCQVTYTIIWSRSCSFKCTLLVRLYVVGIDVDEPRSEEENNVAIGITPS
jgi:hypothetical protein